MVFSIKGGQQLEVMYEPGTPLASGGEEVEGDDIEDGDEGIQGRDIPEFQQLGPVLVEEQAADKIVVGEMELTARSSVERLRQAARYLRVSAPGSKQKIFQRNQRSTSHCFEDECVGSCKTGV